ncbi:MAG: hypothetical protein ACLQO6_10555 [Desulfomonilaceae bacterium]
MLFLGGVSAQAQGFSNFSSSTTGFFSQGASAIGSFFSQDLPGAFDSTMPFLFPPYFGGEVHIRPYFYSLINGQVALALNDGSSYRTHNLKTGRNLDPKSDGMGFSTTGVYVENMVRFQFSRLSLRAYYNAYIQAPLSNYGYVDWLDWRLGADFDVVNSYGVRLGVTCDYYPERPSLSCYITSASASIEIVGDQPVTFGIVAAYNPFTSWTVSPSFEFRYEWPFQNNSSQITQWECAGGLKLPKTVLGSSGIRFGYRQTELVFRGYAKEWQQPKTSTVTLLTAGYFGELVWFY